MIYFFVIFKAWIFSATILVHIIRIDFLPTQTNKYLNKVKQTFLFRILFIKQNISYSIYKTKHFIDKTFLFFYFLELISRWRATQNVKSVCSKTLKRKSPKRKRKIEREPSLPGSCRNSERVRSSTSPPKTTTTTTTSLELKSNCSQKFLVTKPKLT
jgi:hypothetical protein